jgi:hypothetical protein
MSLTLQPYLLWPRVGPGVFNKKSKRAAALVGTVVACVTFWLIVLWLVLRLVT